MNNGVGASAIPNTASPLTVDTSAPQTVGSMAPSSAGNQPSWWERLLPTAGGILGGIGGSFVSPILGSAAGAGAGGAAGKWLEDELTGQRGGVETSGLENAVGGLVGGVGGSIVSKLLPAASSQIGNIATDTLQSQFKSPIDRNIVEDLSSHGMSNAKEVANIAPRLSGPNGAYTQMVTSKLEQLGSNGVNVNISNLDSQLGDLLRGGETGTNAEILRPSQLQNANDVVQKIISPANLEATPAADKAILTASPTKVYQAFTKLRNASYALQQGTGATPGTANNAISQIYGKMSQVLKDAAFTPNGIDSIPLTAADKSQLIDQISNIKDINPSIYANEVTKITDATKLSDLNDLQTNWVQASKALQKGAITGATKTGSSASDIAAGIAPISLSHPFMTAAGLAMKSQTANKATSNILGNASKALDTKIAQEILPRATQAATIAGANLPNDVSQPANQPSAIPGVNQGANIGTGAANMPQSPVEQLYNQLLAQEQTGGGISGNLIPAMQSLAPQVQKQQLAAPIISNLLGAYQNAGGAQGTGGGLLSRLTALIPGTAANTFQTQQASTAAALAQLLGITPAESATLIPQLMQAPGVAQQRIGGLQSILGSINPTQSTIPAF